MAYVYAHTNPITNEVFYIGVGTDSKGKYVRAKNTTSRNDFWIKYFKKYKRKIHILYDKIDKDLAYELEIQLIAFHGRRNKNEGTLVNLTDGGDRGKDTRRRDETLRTIYSYNEFGYFDKEWSSINEILDFFKIKSAFTIYSSIRRNIYNRKNKIAFRYEKVDKIEPYCSKGGVEVAQYDKEGNFITKYYSCKEAARSTGLKYSSRIRNCLRGKSKTAGGFIWRLYNKEFIP